MTRFFASRPSPTSSAAAWSVQRNYKLETAFRADWQWDGGPGEAGQALPLRLGFLCEYDALPGIGHACGHNLIAEVGAGAALGLKGALESLRHGPANAAGLPRQAPAVKVKLKSEYSDYYNMLQSKSLEQTYVGKWEEFQDGVFRFHQLWECFPCCSRNSSFLYTGSNALNHIEEFTQASWSESAQQYALRIAKALAMTALTVIFRSGLLDQVPEDYRQAKLEGQES